MKSSVKGDTKEKVEEKVSPGTEDLLKIVKDLQSKIATLEAEKPKTEEEKEEESALEDYLETPVLFFAYSTAYSIYGDRRHGKSVETPNKEGVKFVRTTRYERRRPGQRGADIVSTCTTKVHSKKLLKWLREHSLYGIKFFESFKDAENVDVTLAEKMAEVNSMISHMSDMQIIERARMTDGVHVSADIDSVRKQLIEVIAKDQLESDSKNRKQRYRNSMEVKDKKLDEKAIGEGAANGDVY